MDIGVSEMIHISTCISPFRVSISFFPFIVPMGWTLPPYPGVGHHPHPMISVVHNVLLLHILVLSISHMVVCSVYTTIDS